MTTDQMTIPRDAIIVGIDGSERDRTCITWGAGAATRAHKPLHLLHAQEVAREIALGDPVLGHAMGGVPELANDGVLATALEETRRHWPDLEVSGSDPWTNPERALLDASEGAHLIIVGSRRVSGLERLLLGRSALAVAMHAKCPVVLLPEGARTDASGPVVVGIDGSEQSAAAAERAFWIASVRGTSVRVVTSWYLEIVDGLVVTTPENPAWAEVEARYTAMAEQVLEPVRGRYPDIAYDIVVRRGPAPQVLVDEASRASLLVLGSRGRGGFRGMLLGSVTHKVIETATSPVMVIRQA